MRTLAVKQRQETKTSRRQRAQGLVWELVTKFLELDLQIRKHLKHISAAKNSPEGAAAWFETLEQFRITETIYKENMRTIIKETNENHYNNI